jgi:predicted nucleotidyltransferase
VYSNTNMVGAETNRFGADSLAAVFATATLAKLLTVLALDPGRTFFQKELVTATGSSLYLVQRELKRLEAMGLVSRAARGRQVEYTVNRAHPAFAGLQDALLNTIGLADVLRDAFAGVADVRLAFVFGSVAKGEDRPGSDLDLLVIGDLGLREVATRVVPRLREIGREPNIMVLSETEFGERIRRGDNFLAGVLAEPKIWIRGDERELAALAD